ncbi:TetR/AcrR family transcriptional regulator [Eubacterium sp. 1001713B170207_170306_E7]|uniref:TetR/AcrR family transcriptional regulator n=1 Tax=Eubacterium sp. 1001713B170207_170306_E7 TaxID=2787097 RepID=UPI00189903E1|nr:TetR/AcrR family transcriptional regulator [Eubacterium sp. 1001713B170207_170306_E7]
MAKAVSDKGLKTKNRILEIARADFHSKGFAKASVKEICAQAGIRTGTFAYYFKTKEDLIKAIYSELHLQTYAFVENHRPEQGLNSIEKNTYTAFLYYAAVFKDDATTRFHADTLRRESIQTFLGQNFRHVYRQFINDCGYTLSDAELYTLSLADLGMRREIVLDFIENPRPGHTVRGLIAHLYLYRSRLFKIDEEQMQAYLLRGEEFEQKYDHSKIKLLV